MNRNIIAIDARMIEMSGIGTYIQHLMSNGIYDYALGNEMEIRKYDPNVKVIPYDASIYSPREQLFFPNTAVRRAEIELIHFPHYNVPLSYRGRFVVTVHDLTHILLPEFLGNKIKLCYAKFLLGHALRKSEHIFTVSENSKRDINQIFGIDKSKISITYDAVDKDFRIKSEGEIKYLYGKYNISRGDKILLYVGNLKPHKNLDRLLEAFSNINKQDMILLLVGKAFTSDDLKKKEEQLGIKEKVIHTGMVSKEELIDLYNLADLFVFPSLYEGFGIPPLEAMACGTPVVCSNNSSIPEIVGDAAVLFNALDVCDISDSIVKVLEDKDLINNLIAEGKDRFGCFSWDSTVETVKHVIESVMNI